MPCYLEENVNAQRGNGVFDASIAGLQRLTALGYGKAGTGLDPTECWWLEPPLARGGDWESAEISCRPAEEVVREVAGLVER